MDKIIALEKQIQRLRKRREEIKTRQAILFFRGVEKIFKEGFCPNLVLDILAQTRATASAIQQQEWEQRARSFCRNTFHNNNDKPQTVKPTDHQSGRAEIQADA